MICTSCKGCDDRISVIKTLHWDYAVKVDACKKLTDRLYEHKWAWPDLKFAVMSLFRDHDNNGFIIKDGFFKYNQGELFPEFITTDQYIVCLPVEEVRCG